MRMASTEQVVEELRKRVTYERTQNALAKELGVSAAFLSDVLRNPSKLSPRLALAAGYEKLPDRYRKISAIDAGK